MVFPDYLGNCIVGMRIGDFMCCSGPGVASYSKSRGRGVLSRRLCSTYLWRLAHLWRFVVVAPSAGGWRHCAGHRGAARKYGVQDLHRKRLDRCDRRWKHGTAGEYGLFQSAVVNTLHTHTRTHTHACTRASKSMSRI